MDTLVEQAAPVSDYYLVLRRTSAPGGPLERGEVVDASGWRNKDKLVEQRYLHALPYGCEVSEPDAQGKRHIVQ